jgi:hypothetical protein
MSIGISLPVTFVNEFSSNIWFLSQQKSSRLAPYVDLENQKSEYSFFDRLAPSDMGDKIGRNSDTVLTDVDWSRRRVSTQDYAIATLVDQEDKLRLIHTPESEIMMNYKMAAGRKMDEIIIGSALGVAYAGKTGSSPVNIPNEQKVGATDGTNFTKLTVETLRILKQKFWENEAVEEGEPLYFACKSSDLINMLRETEVTSSDFNTVKALAEGKIDDYMGFKFIRTELIPQTDALIANFDASDGSVGITAPATGVSIPVGSNRCFAFCKSAIKMGIARSPEGRVSERPDKNYAMQVYYRMSMGGVRMEEEKLVEVYTAA